jgi:hypothetical protein
MATKTLYHVSLLGKLWMGGIAATERTHVAGKGPFQIDVDDCMVSGYVETHEGDFQAIIDMEIMKEVIETTPHEHGYTNQHTFTTIRGWQDEYSYTTFQDCMDPYDERDEA